VANIIAMYLSDNKIGKIRNSCGVLINIKDKFVQISEEMIVKIRNVLIKGKK